MFRDRDNFMLAVNPIGREDLGKVLCLWVMQVHELEKIDSPDIDAWYKVTQSTPSYFGFLATDDGLPVGYVDGYMNYEPATREKVLCARGLYVMHYYRGGVVANTLVAKLLELGREKGADVVYWPTMPGHKADSLAIRNFEPIQVINRRTIVGALEDVRSKSAREALS